MSLGKRLFRHALSRWTIRAKYDDLHLLPSSGVDTLPSWPSRGGHHTGRGLRRLFWDRFPSSFTCVRTFAHTRRRVKEGRHERTVAPTIAATGQVLQHSHVLACCRKRGSLRAHTSAVRTRAGGVECMRYALNVPNFGAFADVRALAQLAHEAE